MTNPNRGASDEVLDQLKAASYERFRLELINSIEQLLKDFDMTWNDLSEAIWGTRYGVAMKKYVGDGSMTLSQLNAIAHVFSSEPYLIFRPRFPWTQT